MICFSSYRVCNFHVVELKFKVLDTLSRNKLVQTILSLFSSNNEHWSNTRLVELLFSDQNSFFRHVQHSLWYIIKQHDVTSTSFRRQASIHSGPIKKQFAFSAFVIQFSFIACFFWLNAMCIEMWSVIRSHVDRETYKRMKPRTLFFWYSLWCWGPSLILILVSMIMDVGPTIPATYVKLNFAEDCWSKCESS